MPAVQLKVSGIDLKSFGSFDEGKHIESLTDGDVTKHSWRHIQVREGKLTGGVFVNSPQSAISAINASKKVDHPCSRQDLLDILHKSE